MSDPDPRRDGARRPGDPDVQPPDGSDRHSCANGLQSSGASGLQPESASDPQSPDGCAQQPPSDDRPWRTTTLLGAFGCAFRGIGQAVVTQLNMKIHIAVAVVALVLCAVLRCTPVEWAVVIVMIGAVLAAEMLNSALENVVDLISPGYDELAGRAKDMAAGAVLVLAIAAVAVGAVIYISALTRIL